MTFDHEADQRLKVDWVGSGVLEHVLYGFYTVSDSQVLQFLSRTKDFDEIPERISATISAIGDLHVECCEVP